MIQVKGFSFYGHVGLVDDVRPQHDVLVHRCLFGGDGWELLVVKEDLAAPRAVQDTLLCLDAPHVRRLGARVAALRPRTCGKERLNCFCS